MIIQKYGVVLRKLENREDLELVRQWRNSTEVSQFMFFNDYITSEMQSNWFTKISNIHNHFFIVEFENKKIGLINLKDINYDTKEAESGFFIGESAYRDSTIGVQAYFALLDFAFEELHLEKIIAHVRTDNKKAIAFNKGTGFVVSNENEELYTLEKMNYFKKTDRIKKLLLS